MAHDPTAPAPPTPSSRPHLPPQFCFNTTALRDFFRLSRSTVDDSLSLHLNSLLQPSRRPFSTSNTPPQPYPGTVTSARTRRQIPGSVCRQFKETILFPSWADRESVLEYCTSLAENPDSVSDDDNPARWGERPAMHMPSDKTSPAASSSMTAPPALPQQQDAGHALPPPPAVMPSVPDAPRDFWGKFRPKDERTDPYSGRDYSYTRTGRATELKTVLDSERSVERIIRGRTWSVLGERCLDDDSGGETGRAVGQQAWEAEFHAWMEKHG